MKFMKIAGSALLTLAFLSIAGFCSRVVSESAGAALAEKKLIQEAEKGDPGAKYILGMRYLLGEGVTRDYQKAANWHRKAAEQGHAEAQAVLAVLYTNGQGVPQDYTRAASLYRMAAQQGNATAQVSLGNMYAEGKGIERDLVLSYAWISLGIAELGTGNPDVNASLENRLREVAETARHGLEPQLTSKQLAEARRLVSGWKPGQGIEREKR